MFKRWQRLGLSPTHVTDQLQCIEHDLTLLGRYDDKYGPSTATVPAFPSDYGRQRDLLAHYEVIQAQHLEVDHPFGEIQPRIIAMSELCIDYFFGVWRDHAVISYEECDRPRCRQMASWIDEVRMGLLASLLARLDCDTCRIVQYLDEDLPFDDGAWYRTKDDNQFYIILSAFLQDGSICSRSELAKSVRQSRKRRPRMMLACLDAIERGDGGQFIDGLERLLDLYVDTEFAPNTRIVTSWDSSILWNVAEIHGLVLPDLPAKLVDLVVTRSSLRLDPLAGTGGE